MSAAKILRWLNGWLQDDPRSVTLALTVLVALHGIVGHFWVHAISPGHVLSRSATAGDVSVLFLGGATVAAMVAGLAGVVVVFALSSPGKRVRTFRLEGGGSLLANWTSAVAVSFTAAGLSLLASYLRLARDRGWGWTFELALLLLLHGALRLLWLLRKLALIVSADDKIAAEEQSAVDVASVVLPDRDSAE